MNATQNHIGSNKTTRRKKTEATSPTIGRICRLDETGKRHFRNPKRPKEISSDKETSNGFLKTTFLPKLKEDETATTQQNGRKITKTERDFYQSLSRLANHYGINPMPTKEFEYPYNIALSLFDTEKQLKSKIKNWDNIRLIQKENKTYFISEERCSTASTLFYIPVIPLYNMLKDKKRKKSAQLLLSVCFYLYRNADIPYYRQENSYLYWNYEMLADWLDQDEEIDENHLYKKELQQSEMIGDLMEQKISHRKNLEIFGKRLEKFKPKDDFDEECFQLSKKVFQLYNDYPEERYFRNAHFNNVPKQENREGEEYYNEETVVSMDKYVSFFADDKGWVYQNLIGCINNEFNEYSELQEPMIFKAFNGSDISKNSLDFENRLFEILIQLSTVLGS
ncbi:hypothetical protein [Chryseobacterium salivictor]|uniref:Uncharacterized protein n=1 Tax=Chryseobacterium salivictor TaxID=2547600 RepID=A0A4P6ZIG4_9FLAO|nr:hypothetical protein [Chryseobacterium salivictor]QBO59581.1 hypothetical protein NBC122_02780 [Chryseobacterium salivictor]